MRMIDVLVLVCLLPLFSVTFSSAVTSLASCQKKYAEKSAPFNADRCIASSFKKICGGSDEKEADFEAFALTYAAVLPVSAIRVETVGIKDKKRLLKCSWTSGNGEMHVLAVCELKEDL